MKSKLKKGNALFRFENILDVWENRGVTKINCNGEKIIDNNQYCPVKDVRPLTSTSLVQVATRYKT